ncbi:MAG: hypothetical protein NZM09_11535 [Ignavibacterium sp.]|nr:hypothetical protein [Ignavibacterium sp.]MCX7610529.1 hypothetical protein [Ignavibacterium sp.]MDW8376310.1 hypothetical protein [Ignavibacteriales bacterium]
MKTSPIIIALLFLTLFVGCKKKENNPDPNVLGGDPNVEFTQVNSTFALDVKIDNNVIDLGENIKVISNNNGLATIKINANVNQSPKLKQLLDRIPANIYDSQGNIDVTTQFKATSEGIQDYFNKDGKAHTLVKYNAKVGDKYILKKSDGTTITRTVTARSEDNDFPYGFYMIKTITVEQDSRIPGIRKFIFKANHKFGIVHVEALLEDGSKISSYIF